MKNIILLELFTGNLIRRKIEPKYIVSKYYTELTNNKPPIPKYKWNFWMWLRSK